MRLFSRVIQYILKFLCMFVGIQLEENHSNCDLIEKKRKNIW